MIIGPPPARLFHVLRGVNTKRRAATTRSRQHTCLAAACLLSGLLPVAATQGQQRTAVGEPPDPASVLPAFEIAREWVDALAVPGIDLPDAEVPIDGAAGVCVLLRRGGRVVGTGADWTGDDLMLRRAVARALGELLGEPAVRNMPDDMRASVGSLVSLELEACGEPVPIIARSYEHAGRQLEPGLNGIAMRRENEWAMLFPAQLLATNTAGEAHRQFLALAADLKLPTSSLEELSKQHGVAVYALRTITVAQTEPSGEPMVTVRGEPVVRLSSVHASSVRAWAAESAAHLLMHMPMSKPTIPSDLPPELVDTLQADTAATLPIGLSGTYNPVSDQFDPLIAPPFDQALGAYALLRFSATPGVDAELAQRCDEAAMKVLANLTETTAVEKNPIESAPACALLVAAISPAVLERKPELAELLANATERLNRSFISNRVFDESLSTHERAVIAWGVVQLCQRDPLRYPIEIAAAAIEQAWSEAPEQQRVALLPWIGWAEADMAQGEQDEMAHVTEQRELLLALCASRVPLNDRRVAPDMAGGLPLASSGRTHATAQSLRPLSWMASAMRDPRLVLEEDRMDRVRTLREMLRFVRQLMVRDDAAWRYRNPERAMGGIRETAWDARQSVPAQALGLLTLLEAGETLQKLAPEQPVEEGPRTSP